MIDRIILSAVLSVTGYNGFFSDQPQTLPLTPWQLQVKAKEGSKSEVCKKKKKSKAVKDLCKRWGKHDA
jgi:hypothetical protein